MATGMSEDQAGAVVNVVNSTGDKLVTNTDLESLQMATQAHLKALRTDLKAGLLDLQVKFMATQIAVAALIVAAIKLF